VTLATFELEPFSRVRFRGPGMLKVVQGDTEQLTIDAPAYVMDAVEVSAVERELRLGYQHPEVIRLAVHRESIAFTLTVRELEYLCCKGVGANVLVPDLDTDRAGIRLAGQGHIMLEHLTADKLEVRIDGAGLVDVAGDVEQQSLDISGAGHYRASSLVSDFASIRVSGAGKADVSVSTELEVNILGAGQVTYEGYPEIYRTISGLGYLKRRRRRGEAPLGGKDHG